MALNNIGKYSGSRGTTQAPHLSPSWRKHILRCFETTASHCGCCLFSAFDSTDSARVHSQLSHEATVAAGIWCILGSNAGWEGYRGRLKRPTVASETNQPAHLANTQRLEDQLMEEEQRRLVDQWFLHGCVPKVSETPAGWEGRRSWLKGHVARAAELKYSAVITAAVVRGLSCI